MDQKGRRYELIVGADNALRINNLQITFDITKNSNNKEKTDSAVIEIYNLSDASLKVLEQEYIFAIFSCGYEETGIKQLFSGEITQVTTRKDSTDRVTQILMGSGYLELNHTLLDKVVPVGKTVKDVIEEVRKQMPGVIRGIYAGFNINSQVMYGYPLTGTPRDLLDEISRAYKVDWRVDQGILYINDNNGIVDKNTDQAPLISKTTGLIEIPYKTTGDRRKGKKDKDRVEGIQFTSLLNPDISPGRAVNVVNEMISGFFKVDSVRHYGGFRDNDWYSDAFCTYIKGGSQ